MSRKEIAYQGLIDLDVLIDDLSNNSPDYFRVTKLNAEFTAGPNIFKFKGNPPLFPEDALVYIEILDSNGDPIYYETDLDLESSEQNAIVTVFVNEDTPPGPGFIILCSTLKSDIDGTLLDPSVINVRWIKEIYIDQSKRSEDPIIFSQLPEVFISGGDTKANYTYYTYPDGDEQYINVEKTNLQYLYYNNTAVLVTTSLSPSGFDATALAASVSIDISNLSGFDSQPVGTITDTVYTSTISSFLSDGIAVLTDPIRLTIQNAREFFQPTTAIIATASIQLAQSASASSPTENYFNVVEASFNNLQPQVGTIARIRAYYKSSGLGDYTLANEVDVTNNSQEFGFTPNNMNITFSIPTIQRFDKIDFKFEFINPIGLVAKQVVESTNNLFFGGNTYIAGDDNLLTGSLWVAGASGSGVQITGKSNASMVRSIGYEGLEKALLGSASAGFVLYSGSISGILGSTETYSGVGLELVANSSSYLKYTTADGGVLDIRTDRFFIGNNNVFISGSNDGALEILVRTGSGVDTKTLFHLRPDGIVSASAFVAFTGSTDLSSSVMLDTSIGLVDGKNIGRIIYTRNEFFKINYLDIPPSEEPNTVPTTNVSAYVKKPNITGPEMQNQDGFLLPALKFALDELNTPNSIFKWNTLNISGVTLNNPIFFLPFENTLTILGNAFIDAPSVFPSGERGNLIWGLRTSFYLPDNNFNLNTFGTVNELQYTAISLFSKENWENAGGNNPTKQILLPTIAQGATAYPEAFGRDYIINEFDIQNRIPRRFMPFRIQIPIPAAIENKVCLIAFEPGFSYLPRTNGSYTDFDFNIKISNLIVLSGRTLFNNAIID